MSGWSAVDRLMLVWKYTILFLYTNNIKLKLLEFRFKCNHELNLSEFNLFFKVLWGFLQISNDNCDSNDSDSFLEMLCDYRFIPCLNDQCHQ